MDESVFEYQSVPLWNVVLYFATLYAIVSCF